MTHTVNIVPLQGSRYALTRAILLYTADAGSDPYATIHPIEHGRGGMRLGAGTPATEDACIGFARAIADRGSFSGFLAPELLYIGPRMAAWWRRPQRTRVWFKTETKDNPGQTLGTRSAVVPHPGLVFVVAGKHWYVHAVKGPDRPTPTTALWRPHYFNVWESGQICEGNIQRPERVTPDTLAAFERAFFESRFTHPNVQAGSTLTGFRGGLYAFWRNLLNGRWQRFPEGYLVPAKKTLATHIKALEKRHD